MLALYKLEGKVVIGSHSGGIIFQRCDEEILFWFLKSVKVLAGQIWTSKVLERGYCTIVL